MYVSFSISPYPQDIARQKKRAAEFEAGLKKAGSIFGSVVRDILEVKIAEGEITRPARIMHTAAAIRYGSADLHGYGIGIENVEQRRRAGKQHEKRAKAALLSPAWEAEGPRREPVNYASLEATLAEMGLSLKEEMALAVMSDTTPALPSQDPMQAVQERLTQLARDEMNPDHQPPEQPDGFADAFADDGLDISDLDPGFGKRGPLLDHSGRRVTRRCAIREVVANGTSQHKKRERKIKGRGIIDEETGKKAETMHDKIRVSTRALHKNRVRILLVTPAARDGLTLPPDARHEEPEQRCGLPPDYRAFARQALRALCSRRAARLDQHTQG